MECAKINSLFSDYGIPPQALPALYPQCTAYVDGSNPQQQTVVHVNIQGRPEEATAALDICFGTSLWMALVIHAVGIEIYVGYLKLS
jgi:hypothetical protein